MTHKNKTVLAITTSRGLGRYAARITVGQGPTLATAMRKAKELFPELVDAQFADAFADERNEMASSRALEPFYGRLRSDGAL